MTDSPLRVLVVDDEPSKRATLSRLVRLEARRLWRTADVVETSSAEDAPPLVSRWYVPLVHAVVTDWCAPGDGDGALVVRAARDAGVPVVVCSGSLRPSWWRDGRRRWWADDWGEGVRVVLRAVCGDAVGEEGS